MNTSTALAIPPGYDPFASYGESASNGNRLFLSFSKGEFLFGQDKEEVPLGTKFIANMAGLKIGWKRWGAKKVIDERMGLLSEGFRIPSRSELGDMDQSQWEREEKDGSLRDPWQLTNELTFLPVDGDEEFVFGASSKGGIGAIGQLCKDYGKLYRQKPGKAPVIKLGRNSYLHKTFGKLYNPVFELVDWVNEPDNGGNCTQESTQAALPPPPAAEPAKSPRRF